MGRHHEPDRGSVEQRLQLDGTRSSLRDHPNRFENRAPARCRCVMALATANPAYSLAVFAKIDELEVAGERTDEHGGVIRRQTGDDRAEFLARRRVASSELLSEPPYVLFEGERLRASLRLNNLSEQIAEQVDVVG